MAKAKKEIELTTREREQTMAKHASILCRVDDDAVRESMVSHILADALEQKIERTRRNRRNKARGKSLEKRIASVGMERVPYSGSSEEFGWGDIKSPYLLGESKAMTPRNPSQRNITILKKDIDDIIKQARAAGKMPFYATSLKGTSDIYIVLTIEDWRLYMATLGLLDIPGELSIHDGKLFANGVPYGVKEKEKPFTKR